MPSSKLIALRVTARKNVKPIINYITYNHIRRVNGKAIFPLEPAICVFCGKGDGITKEHVIPKWVFEKDTDKFFNFTLNGLSLTCNKTTIPVCKKCNGDFSRPFCLSVKRCCPKSKKPRITCVSVAFSAK